MLPRNHGEMSFKEQQKLGLPDGFKLFSPFPFAGMNQQDSRTAMDDTELFLRENFVRVGKANLRTVWDKGDPIYTVPAGSGLTIVSHGFYNIGATNYAVVFLSDGTAVQINVLTEEQTVISDQDAMFYAGGQLPAFSQWGSQYLLISNNIDSNSYWIWDGTVLFSAGTLGPQVDITSGGAGYNSAPTVTTFGGTGSDATFEASIANGAVVSVVVTDPGSGYSPADTVQLAFSGGGSDTSAQLDAVLTAGSIDNITLLDGGSGYTAVTISFSGGGGTGATATGVVTSGAVSAITLTAGGSGYTGTPTVIITDSGAGTGAQALASLTSAVVSSVTIVSGGSGFESTPLLTFSGGGGTGAEATATLTAGIITSVTVTNGGSGYTSTPAIVVQSGINDAASATATLMPFGVSGSSIETFLQRVWLFFPNQEGRQNNSGTFLVSGPSSFTDFATSSGGLIYVTNSPYLKAQYVNVKQSNGYLYPLGDSSVDVISNVQTSGSPSTTTFNYQNTDPQIGLSWRDACKEYSRSILLSNRFGVFGLYGGAVVKVSEKVDDMFNNARFPNTEGAVTPVAAVANIFNQRVFMQLMTIKDPITKEYRNVMLGWDQKDWMILSQSVDLTYISTQQVDSNLTAWGTNGTSLFPLFQTPSAALTKRLSTKLFGAQTQFVVKQAMMLILQAQNNSVDESGIVFTEATIDTEVHAVPVTTPVDLLAPNFSQTVYSAATPDVFGCNLGFTFASNSPDFTLNYIALGYIDVAGIFGSQDLPNSTSE